MLQLEGIPDTIIAVMEMTPMRNSGQKVKVRVRRYVIQKYAIAHRVEMVCEMHK